MPPRGRSRELALQMLFRWEMRHETTAQIKKSFWRNVDAVLLTRQFANKLLSTAVKHAAQTDALLELHAIGWTVERLPAVDRAILRLAICELQEGALDPPIIINEAIELAKTYSSDESAVFINGVLNAIVREKAKGGATTAAG
jgi:transcription antitermination protein NusB